MVISFALRARSAFALVIRATEVHVAAAVCAVCQASHDGTMPNRAWVRTLDRFVLRRILGDRLLAASNPRCSEAHGPGAFIDAVRQEEPVGLPAGRLLAGGPGPRLALSRQKMRPRQQRLQEIGASQSALSIQNPSQTGPRTHGDKHFRTREAAVPISSTAADG
jgi:hypothetical protein